MLHPSLSWLHPGAMEPAPVGVGPGHNSACSGELPWSCGCGCRRAQLGQGDMGRGIHSKRLLYSPGVN